MYAAECCTYVDACSYVVNVRTARTVHNGLYSCHTPPGAAFQARLLDNQEGTNTERYVFGQLSVKCFQCRTS